jgi:hypothetical protein
VIRLPDGLRQAFPYHSTSLPSPSCKDSRLAPYPGFPLCASVAVCRMGDRKGPPGFPDTSLPACHGLCGLRRTFPSKPLRMVLCCLRHVLKPSTSAPVPYRSCISTSGCTVTPVACQDSLCTLHLSCSFLLIFELRHRCNTRYGWVAGPYPTGTSTPQDMPDLSRRDHTESTESTAQSGRNQSKTMYLTPTRFLTGCHAIARSRPRRRRGKARRVSISLA